MMNSSTRRLLAVTVTSALVCTPALAFGGAAHAGTVAAPQTMASSLTGAVTGAVGIITGSTGTPLPAPVTEILDAITATPTGSDTGSTTGTPDPVEVLGLIASTVRDALVSDTFAGGDPTAVISGLTDQLATVPGGEEAIDTLKTLSTGDAQALSDVLLGALPLSDLFAATGGSIPAPIQTLLGTSTPEPSNTDALIAAMTEYYQHQNMTADQVKDDDAAKALPPSALAALLAALQKRSTTTPPATKPTTSKPATSKACTNATHKVKRLQKQLKTARKKHQAAKARSLAKRLGKAKRAKRNAC